LLCSLLLCLHLASFAFICPLLCVFPCLYLSDYNILWSSVHFYSFVFCCGLAPLLCSFSCFLRCHLPSSPRLPPYSFYTLQSVVFCCGFAPLLCSFVLCLHLASFAFVCRLLRVFPSLSLRDCSILWSTIHFYKVMSSVVDSHCCFAPCCITYILLPLLSSAVFSTSSPLQLVQQHLFLQHVVFCYGLAPSVPIFSGSFTANLAFLPCFLWSLYIQEPVNDKPHCTGMEKQSGQSEQSEERNYNLFTTLQRDII